LRNEDEVACFLHCLLQHLDIPGNYARLLFIDFTVALIQFCVTR